KALDAFARHNSSADGHRNTCKACLGTEAPPPPAVVASPVPTQGGRFPLPYIPRFFPEIEAYAEVDWRWWAREHLAAPESFVLLDVETTGFTYRDAITEIAMIGLTGEVLVDTLVNPEQPIPGPVTAKTGISDAMVADQPTFADLLDHLLPVLDSRGILAFN